MSSYSSSAPAVVVPQRRLHAETVATAHFREHDAAYALFARLYEGTDRARFERDLAEKQYVIVLRDSATAELKGFSTVSVRVVDAGRRDASLVFSGDTAIDPDYWGQKALQREFSQLLVRRKLRRPLRPVYWLLISKGYKTYLILARSCPRSVPRHDRDDVRLAALLGRFATDRFGDAYDPSTGIVRGGGERVRAAVASVDDELLGDPHVRFFAKRNPGHAEGEELACLAEIRLRDPLRAIARSLVARVRS